MEANNFAFRHSEDYPPSLAFYDSAQQHGNPSGDGTGGWVDAAVCYSEEFFPDDKTMPYLQGDSFHQDDQQGVQSCPEGQIRQAENLAVSGNRFDAPPRTFWQDDGPLCGLQPEEDLPYTMRNQNSADHRAVNSGFNVGNWAQPEQVFGLGAHIGQPSRPSRSQHPFGDGPREHRFEMVVRPSTPDQSNPIPFRTQRSSALASPHNERLLPLEPSETSSSAPSSPSSTISDVLHCDLCIAQFTGVYRKGNLARHKRQYHRGAVRKYPCEDNRCKKSFGRKDARLKHYRKCHSRLAPDPMVPRKRPVSSQNTEGSDYDYPSASYMSIEQDSSVFEDKTNNTGHGQHIVSDTPNEDDPYNTMLGYEPAMNLVQPFRRGEGPPIETFSDVSMDLEPSNSGLIPSTITDELQGEEDDPWSPQNVRQDERSRELKSQVAHLMHRVGASDASHTSGADDDEPSSSATASLSTSESFEDHNVQDWGRDSQLTICPVRGQEVDNMYNVEYWEPDFSQNSMSGYQVDDPSISQPLGNFGESVQRDQDLRSVGTGY